ncbi:MAG: BON domain-containing protein [Vulcanimicrobiaceae bacterium]
MLTSTDKDLHGAVLEELSIEPRVRVGEIGIAVESGVVTLTGTVRSLAEKWAVEDAVKRVQGVRAIANELQFDPIAMFRRDDTEIAESAADALAWDAFIPEGIFVEVHDGHITLSGYVEWPFQRREAEATIRRLKGVRGVTNYIVVKPTVEPADLKRKIESRFQRRASLDAKHIAVQAEGGTVTLTGTVSSLAEKEDAGWAAWTIPGVDTVENHIVVEL